MLPPVFGFVVDEDDNGAGDLTDDLIDLVVGWVTRNCLSIVEMMLTEC
jgi:hypothetical protein